jgi:hypothetical protein
MSQDRERPKGSVQASVEEIVSSGVGVADRVAGLVGRAAAKAQDAGEDLVGVARSVVNGAVQAVQRAGDSDRTEVLGQVIHGLGQGFAQAALTARLAIEEARSQGRTFAETDLRKMRTDLETLSRLYAETIAEGIKGMGRVTSAEAARLGEHASVAAERLKPAISAALTTVREDPIGSAAGAARAGTDAVRRGAGSLFSSIGAFLSDMGERLNRS